MEPARRPRLSAARSEIAAPLRTAVVGVVRRRQGLGAYTARHLVAAGAEVVGFVASRAGTIPDGEASLAAQGVAAPGFTSLTELAAARRPDAVVVACPARHHEAYLREALRLGLHVLCEKPLVAGSADDAAVAGELVDAFRARGLLLVEQVQWPCTLGGYRALHPNAAQVPPRHFEMLLSPAGRGRSMLVDALSHPLSMVQALAEPTGDVEGLCFSVASPGFSIASPGFSVASPGGTASGFSTRSAEAGRLRVAFRVPTAEAGVVVNVRLETHPSQPRPAGYGVNGLWATRRVRLPEYALSLRAEGQGPREVDLVDPLAALVAEFVAAATAGTVDDEALAFARGEAIRWRARTLASVLDAWDALAG